nr:hypothetical protein [Tanacetum cinerariifolium]
MLKTGDYDLWSMRIEQYLTHTDYALWEVIVNGDAPAAIASVSGGAKAAGEGSTVLVESHHTPSDEAASIGVDASHRGAATIVSSLDVGQSSGNINKTPSMPHDSPLLKVYTLRSDKGRMQHNEMMNLQRQERVGYEAAVRLQEQLDEEERQRIARVHEEASSFNVEWEDIQATIEADKEPALRIQAKEREKYSEAEKARLLVDLINQRKRHFAQQRAQEKRNKPMT